METATITIQATNASKRMLFLDATAANAKLVPARNRKGVICLNAFTN